MPNICVQEHQRGHRHMLSEDGPDQILIGAKNSMNFEYGVLLDQNKTINRTE